MQEVILQRTRRISTGHQWIFSNEIATSLKLFNPGELVKIYDIKKTFIGCGYINPNSLIAIRLLTRVDEPITNDFVRNRIKLAIDTRRYLLPTENALRLVFSEGDFLPGLIADSYNDTIVVQILTAGMESFKSIVLEILDDLLKPRNIVVRSDSTVRTLEGLPLEKYTAKGPNVNEVIIREGPIVMTVDPMDSQKTGYFLDQRQNRRDFAGLTRERTGLDLFCYTGAWALLAAAKGAHVIGIDSSQRAIELATHNAFINNLQDNCTFLKEDVFKFLRDQALAGKKYDFIILDPPSFVKTKGKLKEALKGYTELATLATRLVRRGGYLATCSCSHHITPLLFLETIQSALGSTQAKLLKLAFQDIDHPILMSMPETLYLKCAFLQIL